MTAWAEADRSIAGALELERPPVAIAFVDERPEAVPEFDGQAPSACSFWPRAERGVVYAAAERHFNCPIGAMTMGFDLPPPLQEELGGLVETMCGAGYVEAGEPAHIPADGRRKAGIVYGPLAEMPIEPDAVLMWLRPRQAMLFNEGAGAAEWRERMTPALYGRPTCAAVPAALRDDRPALSLGCAGMRTFTGVGDEAMLGVVPGDRLAGFAEALGRTLAANAAVQPFYDDRQARFG